MKKIFKLPRKGKTVEIDGRKQQFTIIDEITRYHRINVKGSGKIICFQQIKWSSGRLEYRLTYYMLGLKKGGKGRWIFGQYSLMVPGKILSYLLKEARRRKWPWI